ncbi:MAG: hypothetical protein PVG27_01325 [Chloroflexota bacterium]
MSASPTTNVLRLAGLALVGSIALSACSSWSLDLAVVPGTPPPAPAARAVTVTPPPQATPRPTQATPRPTKAPGGQATGNTRGKQQRPERKTKIVRLKPRPAAGPFQMNLYSKGDFMHQATKDWCVAGSTQIMMNIIDRGKPNRSVAFQQRLYERGRRLSPNKAKLGPIGVDLTGWAELLNTAGYGPYEVEASATRRGAIRKAARAIRETGRPVGLVTWRGAHSWVMSGFTATADPAYTNDYQVKAVYIQDTWYPSVSTIWGASDPPNTLVPMGRLKEDYLPYQRPRARYPKRDGEFMLILPVLPANTVAR